MFRFLYDAFARIEVLSVSVSLQTALKHRSISVERERETEVKERKMEPVTLSLVSVLLSTVRCFLVKLIFRGFICGYKPKHMP